MFNASAVDIDFGGSYINIQQTCIIQVLPVFNCSIYLFDASAPIVAGSSLTLVLYVFTSGLSVTMNIDFGDGTAMTLNLTDTNRNISKLYSSSGMYRVNVTGSGAYSDRMSPSILTLNVSRRFFIFYKY